MAVDLNKTNTVLQAWVGGLTFMQQTVLLTAIRGPDGIGKYHPTKYLLRWFRRCVLYSAMDRRILTTPFEEGGASFTGKSFDIARHGAVNTTTWMDELVGEYLRSLDELPHHFQMHFVHAAEILGYKHPDANIRAWWLRTYTRLVHDLHLWPETEAQLDRRLGDDRDQWLERNDSATVS